MNELLTPHLNRISAYLAFGFDAHRKTANDLRSMPKLRGYARWHDGESEEDALIQLGLDKLLRDNIGFSPKPDAQYIAGARNIDVTTFEGFKAHFPAWIEREELFLKSIMEAINLMRDEDVEIYNELCKLAGFVKNEKTRAKWVYDGLAWMDWNKHHIAVESKWLHDYFTDVWKSGTPIDFNVG